MAQVKFTFPVQEITGQVDEKQKLSFRTRYGKTHPYHYTTTTYKPHSEAQSAHRLRWADARRQAFAELQDPTKHAEWLTKFKQQKRYVRLDCFVSAELLKATKQ